MTRLAYAWIITLVVFALGFHSYEESERAEAIRSATRDALYLGIKAGCAENNKIRDQIWDTAAALHSPDMMWKVRSELTFQDCDADATRIVRIYLEGSEE